MSYRLQDLIDIEHFQNLQDRLNQIYCFPSAIIDNDGNILTATAWQDICTKFHRQNEECRKKCIQSDQYILSHLHEANPAVTYRCPHGLVDNATPIIIDGVHYGNFFTGQFFMEKPDLEYFRRQAKEYGFDEAAYLEAVAKVPIWTQEQLNHYLFFIKGLIAVIAESGLKNLKEKVARKRIEDSEEHATTILQQMQDGFWIVDEKDARILDANDAMCRLLGFNRDELLKMTVADVEVIDTAEMIACRMQHLIQVGSDRFESRFRCKNGRIIDVGVSVTYLSKRNVFFGFHRDITERKRAEAMLKESLQRAQQQRAAIIKMTTCEPITTGDIARGFKILTETASQALEVSRVGIWLLSEKGNELICSDLFETSTATHSEGIRLKCEKFPKYFAALHAENSINAIDAHTDPRTSEFTSDYLIPLGIASMMDASIRIAGRLAGVVCIEHVGENRQWHADEEAFAGMVASVAAEMLISKARKVTEEARARLEEQLHQAQKMESVGRLAGGVAHDFNNMLQAILSNVTLILQDIPPGNTWRENMEEIQKCALRSADLTRQLLAFARKQTVIPKVLDLNSAIEGMLKMLRRLIGENINLIWMPAAHLWPVKMDPSQIDQILANLCVNARDAIGGIGKVTIQTANISFNEAFCTSHVGFVPGNFVMLTVSDSGSGMDKETIQHLFEPFFTTKGIGHGTGLGLATVYGIVKQNLGFINVTSEPGCGSTFKIFLPQQSDKKPLTESKDLAHPISRGHETVLVVEDEPAILRIVSKTLEGLGYTLLTASTPAEAIRHAKEHNGKIDLLITDVVMPEMNGRELSNHLLQLHPGLKRLYMSGYTADVMAHHGVLDGGINFIEKPFTIPALADKVRKTLA